MHNTIKNVVLGSVMSVLTASPMLTAQTLTAQTLNQGMGRANEKLQDGANTFQGMSRSGRFILYTNNNELYLRDVKTQTGILISNSSAPEFALSPNGRYAAFVRQQAAPLASLRVVLDRVTNIETIIPSKSESNIGLSNNGYVLYVKSVGTDNQLIRLNLNDKSETLIATGDLNLGPSQQRNPLSADGNIALFKSGASYQLYNATTQDIRLLAPTRNGGVPVFISAIDLASSGKFVAIFDNNTNGTAIFQLDLSQASQVVKQIDLPSKNIVAHPNTGLSISADGRFVSFRGDIQVGHPEWEQTREFDNEIVEGEGYPRIFRADFQTDTVFNMSRSHTGGIILAGLSQSSIARPIINMSTILSDDGRMLELSTSSANIISGTTVRSLSEGNYHVFDRTGFSRTYQFVDMPNTDTGFKPFAPMTLVGNNQWEGTITFDGVGAESFKFDAGGVFERDRYAPSPDWSINFGVSNTPNQAAANGGNIPITGGAGTYKITFNDQTLAYTITKQQTGTSDWRRTLVFVEGQTQAGQDMFIRGGLDHAFAQNTLGINCTQANKLCAIPIRHLNLRNATTAPWKNNDTLLDWHGAETGQSTIAQGSPLDWTINLWPATWGTKRTVAIDGFGETPLNLWGAHYWMFDVEMDCTKTFNGWFELKSFIANGPGWEGNISQPGAPYVSGNHFAQCGKMNVFKRGQNNPVTIRDL